MRRLILVIFLLESVHSTCPEGLDIVAEGQCRGKYATFTGKYDVAATEAINKCNEIRAIPVTIHNDEQQSYWRDQVRSEFILGLVCNTNTSKWEWANGSAVDYKPPKYDSHLNSYCSTAHTWVLWSDGFWTTAGAENPPTTFDISCTTQLKQVVPVEDSCERFEDDSDDGVCYQVGAAAESWQDAQMICRKLGANLASIHNLQENSFLRRLAVSKGAGNGLFLGATTSGKGQNLGWIDGSDWDYENFYQGFPRAGFGDCIAMDTTTSAGQWMNIECTAKLPVACIREKISTNAPNATCRDDTWKDGELITSPGFPFSSSTPCDFFLAADPGKRVEAEIVLLEANSCCDSLIIYDGYLGGTVMA
ncbi:hypothetical protein PENTCL1PPCAC_21257, partial [Pristionchus entomophagus]